MQLGLLQVLVEVGQLARLDKIILLSKDDFTSLSFLTYLGALEICVGHLNLELALVHVCHRLY